MVGVERIAVQHLIVGDQTLGALGQKNLVAKFHRFLRLAPLDQIGVGLEDGVDLLLGGNLFSLQHSATALVDHSLGQLAVAGDLVAKRINAQTGDEIARAGHSGFGFFDYLARIGHDLFSNADQLPILGLLLLAALLGGHALDRLHAAARAAGAVGKALYSVGKFLVEVCDEAGNSAHRVPQQGGIGGVMNVVFHYRGVDAESLAVFQTQLDSGLDDELIDIAKCLRRKPVEGAVERIVLGDRLAVKSGKAA